MKTAKDLGVIRVFPTATSYTPTDEMAFIGEPPGLFIPQHEEVHISCTFTWDMDYAEYLQFLWEGVTNKPVKLGGLPTIQKPKILFQGCMSRKASCSQAEVATTIAASVVCMNLKAA